MLQITLAAFKYGLLKVLVGHGGQDLRSAAELLIDAYFGQRGFIVFRRFRLGTAYFWPAKADLG